MARKIHSHWKQAASHRCCWQMTVAGHHQSHQEEKESSCVKASRQQAREFSSSFLGSQRKPSEGCLLSTITLPWSQLQHLLMRFWCMCCVLVNSHWQQMPWLTASTLKQMMNFRDDAPLANDRLPLYSFIGRSCSKDNRSGIIWMCSCSHIRYRSVRENDMIYIWNDLCFQPSTSGHSLHCRHLCLWIDCRWCQGLYMEWLQTLDKLPSLILLVFDLETDVESLHITRGHRLWTNVFPVEPRSNCASWFMNV